MSGSKTLDNGLKVLKVIATKPFGITLSEIAGITGLHPTVTFRLLHTLEDHQLIRRDAQKRYFSAPGLLPLAASVDSDLRAVAEPVLRRLSDEAKAASYLMVPISADEVIAELVVQPSNSAAFVSFSVGSVHAINRGSGGLAILAGRPFAAGEDPAVTKARQDGVAVSDGQVIPNVLGIASPVSQSGSHTEASIGVSVLNKVDLDKITNLVKASAAQLSQRF